MKAVRTSGIELLRIVAMLGVVAHHYAYHGGLVSADLGSTAVTQSLTTNVLISVAGAFGRWGVDVFVLLSAYFLAQRPWRPGRLTPIVVQVWTTSVLIFLAATVWLGVGDTSPASLWSAFAPVLSGRYWFATAFVVLLLLAPMLNVFMRAATRSQHLALAGGAVAAWGLLALARPVVPLTQLGYSEIGWFVVLYLIGGYFARYGWTWNVRALARATLVLGFLLMGVTVAVDLITPRLLPGRDLSYVLGDVASPLVLPFAVAAVLWAISARPWTSRLVNAVAATTFGVYLIHDNSLMRGLIWDRLLHTTALEASPWLPLHALASTVAVFLACSALEWLRATIVQPPAVKVAQRTVVPLASAAVRRAGAALNAFLEPSRTPR